MAWGPILVAIIKPLTIRLARFSIVPLEQPYTEKQRRRTTRVFWALLLIAGIIAFVKFPSFRKTIFVIAGVLVLAVVGYLEHEKQQTEDSKKLVRVEELEFADLRLGPESFGSAYKLVGRIKNNSRYTVFRIQATIHVLDCDEKSNCEVVGEEERNIAPVIPPGQVRDIDDSIYFGSGTHVRGHFQWNYTIKEIQARP
jgi:hypothetical protein